MCSSLDHHDNIILPLFIIAYKLNEVLQYLGLTFGERVGFVYHLPLRALGISLMRFVTEDDPSLTLHKKALQPLSLRREPTQKSCFPRPKTVFVQQTWFIFYGMALPCFPSGLFFPPFSRSYPW